MVEDMKKIAAVARALWQYEVDDNQHDEPFELSWYSGQAKAVIKALEEYID